MFRVSYPNNLVASFEDIFVINKHVVKSVAQSFGERDYSFRNISAILEVPMAEYVLALKSNNECSEAYKFFFDVYETLVLSGALNKESLKDTVNFKLGDFVKLAKTYEGFNSFLVSFPLFLDHFDIHPVVSKGHPVIWVSDGYGFAFFESFVPDFFYPKTIPRIVFVECLFCGFGLCIEFLYTWFFIFYGWSFSSYYGTFGSYYNLPTFNGNQAVVNW